MTETTSTSDNELELRLEKMRLEIADLKNKQAWDRRVGRILPIVSALVPVLALVFTVQQFSNQQSLTRQAMAHQAESDIKAAKCVQRRVSTGIPATAHVQGFRADRRHGHAPGCHDAKHGRCAADVRGGARAAFGGRG